MKRFSWLLTLLLLPLFAFAEGSMSFAPPPGDYSVVYLGNIFGSVDGVLSGTGSQMLGTMLGVFNAAVLAIGGILIMYIILVSTLNTAHEGEMLGHKWSSIWVPIRTVFGLALLVPKTSGYCLMQIFVMWVVIQGVGVADKVWNAALDYLNRGGVIIQANMSENISTLDGGNQIAGGAATMLYGQICMAGLQTQLENARTTYNDQLNQDNPTGPCAGTPSSTMQAFCDTPVPNFINSVDPLNVQIQADSSGTSPTSYSVNMPNLDSTSIYAFLNGICGTIKWNSVDTSSLTTTTTVIDSSTGQCVIDTTTGQCETVTEPTLSSMSESDIEMVKMTRGMAVGQMYTALATTAEQIVGNDPQITTTNTETTTASLVAVSQFGVPLDGNNVCDPGASTCTNWGQDPSVSATTTVLLQGDEFQDAIADYNTMMEPTLNLMAEATNASQANSAREFIQTAQESGWIMAGSYFFNLVQLNGNANPSNEVDEASGLENSTFDTKTITSAFDQNPCTGAYANLCVYFNNDETYLNEIVYLIDGSGQTLATKPSFSSTTTTFPIQTGTQGSTAYGYVGNGMNIVLPGQPGNSGVDLNNIAMPNIKFSLDFKIPNMNINPCLIKIPGFGCIFKGGALFNPIVNNIIIGLLNTFLQLVLSALNPLVDLMVNKTIMGFTYIFIKGVEILSTPGVNPVVALATMGITYINFAMSMFIAIAVATVGAALLSVIGGPAIFALLMLFSPIFLSWITVMLGIAFITAYYVPFLPYMLFMFGAIGWFITVIEAMVAAPIVALGVAHPEGHDALGKSEQGLMILLNVFLRPGMMIIGYITGIALSYVGIWSMNAGFQNVFNYMKGSSGWGNSMMPWAYIFGFFFSSLLYTSTYLTIVQKAFTLIAVLPDKVLRWIGGQAEQTGQETSQWAEEGKNQVKEGAEPTHSAAGQITKQAGGYLGKGVSKLYGRKGNDGGNTQFGGGA